MENNLKDNNNNNNNNNNNVYFKSLSYTNVLFKLEMNAQQNKIFWIVRWIKYLTFVHT